MNFKHGKSHSPEYEAHKHMIQRCYNTGVHNYNRYGGRGITVCRQWLESFECFYADMGPRPSPIHSIERKDVNGNYTPENCIWATVREQSRNKQSTVKIAFRGDMRPLAEISEITGIKYATLYARIFKFGLSPDEAVIPRDRRTVEAIK